jgi:hypothetical protein
MRTIIVLSVAFGFVLCLWCLDLVNVVYPGQVPPPPQAPLGIELNLGGKLIFDADLPQPYLSIDDEKGGDICYYYDGKRQWCMPKQPDDGEDLSP